MDMADPIRDAFLARQHEDAKRLTRESDIVRVVAEPRLAGPPERYLVELHCRGLAGSSPGNIREHGFFLVGIQFPSDYLRRVDPTFVLCMLHPLDAWHPNLQGPFVCAGKIAPGTGLLDLTYRVFELVTFQNVVPREDDALNPAACAWARRHQHLFPLDRRPLRRSAPRLGPGRPADGSGSATAAPSWRPVPSTAADRLPPVPAGHPQQPSPSEGQVSS